MAAIGNVSPLMCSSVMGIGVAGVVLERTRPTMSSHSPSVARTMFAISLPVVPLAMLLEELVSVMRSVELVDRTSQL